MTGLRGGRWQLLIAWKPEGLAEYAPVVSDWKLNHTQPSLNGAHSRSVANGVIKAIGSLLGEAVRYGAGAESRLPRPHGPEAFRCSCAV